LRRDRGERETRDQSQRDGGDREMRHQTSERCATVMMGAFLTGRKRKERLPPFFYSAK